MSKNVEATARHCQRSRIFTLLKANSVLDGTGVVLQRPMFWQRKTMENFILKRFCIFIFFALCFLEIFTSFLMRSALWYWKEWNSSSFYFISFPDQRLGHQWPILAYQKKTSSVKQNISIEQVPENLFCLFSFFFWLHSMWDPNSPTRDWTCAPCSGRTES